MNEALNKRDVSCSSGLYLRNIMTCSRRPLEISRPTESGRRRVDHDVHAMYVATVDLVSVQLQFTIPLSFYLHIAEIGRIETMGFQSASIYLRALGVLDEFATWNQKQVIFQITFSQLRIAPSSRSITSCIARICSLKLSLLWVGRRPRS